MNSILALDCTLRDGGYCNKWQFGKKNISKIIDKLIAAKVEIIECGFLTDQISYDPNMSKYTHLDQLKDIIPQHGKSSRLVVMINYGEYSISALPNCQDTVIDGIRVAFHKKNRYEALRVCREIRDKGYLVFIQPMVTMLYSDEEFVELAQKANEINPYAFYIVDSFGMMNRQELMHFWDLAEETLLPSIHIGFHSHNNLQMALSNAQCLLNRERAFDMIIDGSVYGMGRGAGNLNLELILNELNIANNKEYQLKPILQIMDEILDRFYEAKPWGYTLPNYLSAIHMIHPNYAGYLNEKKTLSAESIDEIFSMIDPEKGCEYDEQYISDLYIRYMSAGMVRSDHLTEIKNRTKGRKVLLIAPGRNAILESNKIIKRIQSDNPVVISINHEYPLFPSDYIFVSNIRRFKELDRSVLYKTISTSNIKSDDTYASVDYYKLLNAMDGVRDNAGLMAIKFVTDDLEISDILVAGLDGYSSDVYSNFETKDMALIISEESFNIMNYGLKKMLKEYKKSVGIDLITTSLLE